MRFRLTYQGELRPTQRDPIGDKALLELDLDATQPAQTALLAKLADAWIAGSMPNQAIREGANHETNIGHATFQNALRTGAS